MKPIWKVFLIIGTLVFAFIVWELVFNDGGITQTVYNSLANAVNNTYQTITGDSGATLLPSWTDAGVNTDSKLGDF